MNFSGLTIGVITHDRSSLFGDLLVSLKASVEKALAQNNGIDCCAILVVNNSGQASRHTVQKIVDESDIASACPIDIVDSPENNIAVGRNLILDRAKCRYIAFIDDDEYPEPDWICNLYVQFKVSGAAVVAGPIEPVYPEGTTAWVAALDLHNKGSLKTGDKPKRVATGNCMLDMEQIKDHRFDPEYGLTGGSDALFFDQLAEKNLHIVWREDAIVNETIPVSRTGSRYMIFRCMTQGYNFRRVLLRKAGIIQKFIFLIKAVVVGPASVCVGFMALPLNTRVAAKWLKRGFTNLGKLHKPSKRLYG